MLPQLITRALSFFLQVLRRTEQLAMKARKKEENSKNKPKTNKTRKNKTRKSKTSKVHKGNKGAGRKKFRKSKKPRGHKKVQETGKERQLKAKEDTSAAPSTGGGSKVRVFVVFAPFG